MNYINGLLRGKAPLLPSILTTSSKQTHICSYNSDGSGVFTYLFLLIDSNSIERAAVLVNNAQGFF